MSSNWRFRTASKAHGVRELFNSRLPARQDVPTVIDGVLREGSTFLGRRPLLSLYAAVERAEDKRVPGILVEAGCAEGGSAIVMASAKSPGRQFNVYDVFGQIPPPSVRDGTDVHDRYEVIRQGLAGGVGGRSYYGYQPDLRQQVSERFSAYDCPVDTNNIHLIEGDFFDTLQLGGETVAVAHVDGDWYDSVVVCLERILPRLAKGGVMIVDDYYSWSGCHDAVNDVMSSFGAEFTVSRWKHPRLQISRR